MGAHDHQEAGSLSSQKGVALYPPMHKILLQSNSMRRRIELL